MEGPRQRKVCADSKLGGSLWGLRVKRQGWGRAWVGGSREGLEGGL